MNQHLQGCWSGPGCATLGPAARSAVGGKSAQPSSPDVRHSLSTGPSIATPRLSTPAQVASRPLDRFAVFGAGPRNSTALRSKAPQEDFTQVARGRTEGREAAKVRARHLSADTQYAKFILSLSKDFECHSGCYATLGPAARSAVGDKSAQPCFKKDGNRLRINAAMLSEEGMWPEDLPHAQSEAF